MYVYENVVRILGGYKSLYTPPRVYAPVLYIYNYIVVIVM